MCAGWSGPAVGSMRHHGPGARCGWGAWLGLLWLLLWLELKPGAAGAGGAVAAAVAGAMAGAMAVAMVAHPACILCRAWLAAVAAAAAWYR